MGCNCGGGRRSSVPSSGGVPQSYRITHPNGANSFIGPQSEAEKNYRAYKLDELRAARASGRTAEPGVVLERVNLRSGKVEVDPTYTAPVVSLPEA